MAGAAANHSAIKKTGESLRALPFFAMTSAVGRMPYYFAFGAARRDHNRARADQQRRKGRSAANGRTAAAAACIVFTGSGVGRFAAGVGRIVIIVRAGVGRFVARFDELFLCRLQSGKYGIDLVLLRIRVVIYDPRLRQRVPQRAPACPPCNPRNRAHRLLRAAHGDRLYRWGK